MEIAPATKTGYKCGIILHRCISTMNGTNWSHTNSMTTEDVGLIGRESSATNAISIWENQYRSSLGKTWAIQCNAYFSAPLYSIDL